MKLVIDTNRIVAALVKNGLSRTIIFNKRFKFYTPDHTLQEIENHKLELLKKAELTSKNFDLLLSILLEKIIIVSKDRYEKNLSKVENLISDNEDTPFLAVAISINADGVWSDDRDFQEQSKMRILTTKDMLELIRIN